MLELRVASLSKTQNEDLLSVLLSKKLQAFDDESPQLFSPSWKQSKQSVVPLFPHAPPSLQGKNPTSGQVFVEDSEVGYNPVVPRATLGLFFAAWDPRDGVASPDRNLFL